MKEKRNLSGVYTRYQNPDGTWDNRCFEDLPKEIQEDYLKDKDIAFLKRLVYILSDTLTDMGDKLDIFKE
jgi:hypothetical protein